MSTQQASTAEGEELDLRAIIRPIRARWWIVLLIVIVGTVAAYLIDARKPKVYQANTSVYVNLNDNVAAQFALGSQQFQLNTDNELADLARLLQSPGAALIVEHRLHNSVPVGTLEGDVNVTADTTTDFIDITANGSTGQQAAAIANGYAAAFIDQGRQQVNSELRQLMLQTNDQLNALPASGPGVGAQRSTLLQRLKALQIAQGNPDDAEQQVAPAGVPGSPVSPDPKKTAIFAFFISLLIAIVVVYVLERLDQRLKDLNGLISLYKYPLLAVVPHSSNADPKVDGMPTLPTETIESIRMLRMGIGLQSLDAPIKTLLVTSAMTAEGKSTVSRDLALVYREAGIDVAVIDADLRRGSLTEAFAPKDAGPGLTGILLGEVSVDDAKVAAHIALPSDGRRRSATDVTEVTFIPSGGPAANPPAILGSMRMASLLRELADEHELLIIDSPPLLPVSDTLPLLSMVDGVIVVGRVRYTRRDAIRRVRHVISGISRANVLGLVANDIPASSRSYLYGYGPYQAAEGEPVPAKIQ